MSYNVWILTYILNSMCGPNVTPKNVCFSVNDLDKDGDVDLYDIAEFQNMEYGCEVQIDEQGTKVCAFVEEAE